MCSVYSVRAVWCWAEVAAGRPFPGFFSFPLEANSRRVVSHEVVLGGKLAAKTSFSLSRPSSPRVEELKGTALYSRLREYLLTPEQLKENGRGISH